MARTRIIPNPENCTEEQIRIAANCAPTRASHRRMMAILSILKKFDPAIVAELYGVTNATIRNWIQRFNERGIDGLIEAKSTGAPRKIAVSKTEPLRKLILSPDIAGETHWTARKFHGYIRKELDIEVGYSTLLRWFHEQKFSLQIPQPWPDRQDETLREVFRVRLKEWLRDESIDLWYMDEVGVEGDPRPRRRWAEKGEKARMTKNGGHLRMSVAGMVCPRTGQFYALEFSHSDSVVFQTFLRHANRDITRSRPRNLLICDNASWHKLKSLDWGSFEPIFLPPYSPDLNPIERLWRIMKAEWFSDFVAKDREALVARLDKALCWLIERETGNQETCSIDKSL